ncbi:cytochrome P450 [Lentithecium fluviatile CBS 122367]|uniref:Cytochrome P450 n=1 Tax=Lentithecium fluviatile CBS 122367 TaxID=1168545 RepID=A0A6G1IC07_9PLEO|nr:cytochrome P450 [Lentithecium fluviatile CBS 122367]
MHIQKYLLFAHPTLSVNDVRPIPTCEYRWQNGQGDSKTHGGIYRIWSGMTPEIVVTHPDPIWTIFNDSNQHIKASNNDAGWLMGQLLRECLGLISDSNDLRLLPFWVFVNILYGELNDTQREKIIFILPLREALFRRIVDGDLRKYKCQWEEIKMSVYLARRDAEEEPPIVEIYKAVGKGSITSKSLLQTLEEMLFANLDVTIGGLSWNLLFLASDKRMQDMIQQEFQNRARPQGATRAWEEYIASLNTLLNASILESARLKPLSAFSVPQSALFNRIIGSYRIPAGINFIVGTYELNIRNPYWGENRGKFQPTWFLKRKPLEMRY